MTKEEFRDILDKDFLMKQMKLPHTLLIYMILSAIRNMTISLIQHTYSVWR